MDTLMYIPQMSITTINVYSVVLGILFNELLYLTLLPSLYYTVKFLFCALTSNMASAPEKKYQFQKDSFTIDKSTFYF